MAKSKPGSDAASRQYEYLQTKLVLEDYMDKIYRATHFLQENRCKTKSIIREAFAELRSRLHQREMLLCQQVDAVINCQTASLPNITPKTAVDKSFPLTISNSRRSTNRWVINPFSSSPGKTCSFKGCESGEAPLEIPSKEDWKSKYPKPLRFTAEFKQLKESIRTFGCLDIDYESMEDQNFTFIDIVREADAKVDHQSSDTDDQYQIEIEVSSDTSSSSSDSFEILPDNKASSPYDAKKDNNKDADFAFTGSFSGGDPDATEMRGGGLPADMYPEASVADGISCEDWLKKTGSHASSFSNGGAVTQDCEDVFPSSSCFKTKESKTASLYHISDLSSDVSDLSSDLKDMSFGDESKNIAAAKNAVASNVNDELQNSRISSSETCPGATPDFTSIINEMLGEGNSGWVDRQKFSTLSRQCDRSMTAEVKQVCGDQWLAGRVHLKVTEIGTDSESALHLVYDTEESRPVHSIRKMFSPYFRSHDKNSWLVKSCTLRKKSRHS